MPPSTRCTIPINNCTIDDSRDAKNNDSPRTCQQFSYEYCHPWTPFLILNVVLAFLYLLTLWWLCTICWQKTFLGKSVLNWDFTFSYDSWVLSLKKQSAKSKPKSSSMYLCKRYQGWNGNIGVGLVLKVYCSDWDKVMEMSNINFGFTCNLS